MRIGRIGTAALLALVAGAAAAQDAGGAGSEAVESGAEAPREKCFGAARAGENDGIGLGEDTARSTTDYQGDAWIWVPRGTCQTMTLPAQTDGTPRRGAIRPLDRDGG